MARLAELRQRIRAVENIQTITRTLATVAAAKLSRIRRRAAGLGIYAGKLREILFRQQVCLARAGPGLGSLSVLLRQREPVTRLALLVITADRGMCGGYNLEVCRFGLDFWERRKRAGQEVRFVLKGEKGVGYFRHRRADIRHQEPWRRGAIGAGDVERLLGVLLDLYRSGEVDEVHGVYTEFLSPIRRRPRAVRLLPVELPAGRIERGVAEAIPRWHYEPDFAEMVDELLAVYLRVQLLDLLLESSASEQGARMITMEEATERADKSLQEYRVQHNRLRREAITTDLLGAVFASRAAEGAGSTRAGKA